MTNFRLSLIAAIVGLAIVSRGKDAPTNVVQATAPDYPRVAQLAHVEGEMVEAVDVAPDGKVSDATIVSGPALREMRQESIAAATQWIFAAGSKQRKELLTFEFKIEGNPNQDGQEVKFLPPNRLVVSVHPIETQDPAVTITHPRHR